MPWDLRQNLDRIGMATVQETRQTPRQLRGKRS
jgi:hypothetical protein